ncbi:hypothetical protein [Mesorhizobium sp. Mes31]|uniref:hypothetical protein n=1 Tax=Mesorhizobium sp. Mes31 TaxID=2926017 RepID=UPI00211910EF|nr:hypothetical protein [Mesorhizobium sp. Mes31]
MKPPPSLAFRAVSSLSTPRFCVPERGFVGVSYWLATANAVAIPTEISNKSGGYQHTASDATEHRQQKSPGNPGFLFVI